MKRFSFLLALVFSLTGFIQACVKPAMPDPDPVVDPPDTTHKTPVDPPVENSMGFFLGQWKPKNFSLSGFNEAVKPSAAASVFVTIDAADVITKIPATIFGQNANIWMGQMVTEPVLMNHLKNLKPGVIRFPGGSISDVFFWNVEKNKRPADVPAELPDASGVSSPVYYWYGTNEESWTMSVNSYYSLLQQTGSEGLITVNYGYARYGTSADPVAAAAHMAADWVRFDNGRTKYWEIGNESNGTWEAGYRINKATNRDGQPEIITGALYAQHAKIFMDSMRKAAQEINKTIQIGVYLLEAEPASWQTPTDKGWNTGVLSNIENKADYYVIHSYYTPYKENSSPDIILSTATDVTANMMRYVKTSITNAGLPVKPIALDEWNITSEGSMQQVSFVNGMHATILLGEALKNKYGQTSRWDLANGWSNGNDHGLFNIGDEPGVSKWNPRPAFYYMYFFQKMIGDRMLKTATTGSVIAYASSFSSGEKAVILVNKNNSAQIASVQLENATAGSRYYWYTLTGGTDNGGFSRKVYVNGKGPSEASGGPATEYANIKPNSALTAGGIKLSLPARSVVYLVIDK